MIPPRTKEPLIFPSHPLSNTVRNTNDSMSAAGIECVCIVGLGVVGESLLREFSQAYATIGFDISEKRIEELRAKYRDHAALKLTSNEVDLRRATHYLLAVPTFPRTDYSADISHLKSALSTVVRRASPDSTIVIAMSPLALREHCSTPSATSSTPEFLQKDLIPGKILQQERMFQSLSQD